mgnify:CR=1 FL=1
MHGGLTYGPTADRWIGFDCAHAEDFTNPKSEEYVRTELANLAARAEEAWQA